MFSGGDHDEVSRWLRNFATAHAKREHAGLEAVVDDGGGGGSYAVRLRLGAALAPPAETAPLELSFAEVAGQRGRLDWCAALAARVRELGRGLVAGAGGGRRSA